MNFKIDVGFEKQVFNFALYPNPANSSVAISGLALGSKIEVVNILGETIYEFQANESKELIDVNSTNELLEIIKPKQESRVTLQDQFRIYLFYKL